MGDYYLAEQLASKLGLTLEEIEQAQARGLIQPLRKKGLVFYTSQHAYKLRAACLLRRKKGLSWEDAIAEVSKRPLYQVSGG